MASGAPPVARLLIEYDGTEFQGWAAQPGERTVQGELERALATALRRERVALTVAGRTDAGVHVSGQVASYEGELNAIPNFGKKSIDEVIETLHARGLALRDG